MKHKAKPADARDLIGEVEVSNGIHGRRGEKGKLKKMYFKVYEEEFD